MGAGQAAPGRRQRANAASVSRASNARQHEIADALDQLARQQIVSPHQTRTSAATYRHAAGTTRPAGVVKITTAAACRGLTWNFCWRPEQDSNPAAYCLGGTYERSPDVARRGLMCRLAAPIVADSGPASPRICHCWLPSGSVPPNTPSASLATSAFTTTSAASSGNSSLPTTARPSPSASTSPRSVKAASGACSASSIAHLPREQHPPELAPDPSRHHDAYERLWRGVSSASTPCSSTLDDEVPDDGES
jgi:hypothetical protein